MVHFCDNSVLIWDGRMSQRLPGRVPSLTCDISKNQTRIEGEICIYTILFTFWSGLGTFRYSADVCNNERPSAEVSF